MALGIIESTAPSASPTGRAAHTDETKFSLGSDIWRVFCFFDEGRLVILLNGFQKKTQKTPKTEISIALRLKEEYFEEKRKGKI